MTIDRSLFYKTARAKLGTLGNSQVEGLEAVLTATEGQPLSHRAYSLATAWWETNKTMQPVVEAYWLSEAWRKKHLRYWPHHGRGYVQLTWVYNYAKADAEAAEAGLIKAGELINNPDLAMRPDIAALVLRKGMDEGWFTGVKLSTVLPSHGTATRKQYMDARTIINGKDKSDEIEDFAQIFERSLRDAGQS